MTRWLIAILLLAAPAFAQRADSLLILADDGGLAPTEARAIRNVTASALRARGASISEERSTEGVQALDDQLIDLARLLGARRIFVLRIGGRLGAKIPLSLEEVNAQSLAPIFAASLTATGIEECDTIAARLASAVIDRVAPGDTAEMRTVTAQESRPFQKKPGERFFFIGLPVPLYNGHAGGSPVGFSLGYGYEAEFFRLEVTGGGYSRDSDGVGYFMLSAAYIPLAGEWSPYVGGGLGYMSAGETSGMGASVEGGLELFRLHGVRLLAGLELKVPFFQTGSRGTYVDNPDGTTSYSSTPNRTWYPAGFLRLGF